MAMFNLFRKARRLAKRLVNRRARPVPGEQGAEYYDDLYRGDKGHQVHYRLSSYYSLWTIIVDRLRRSGCPRVLEVGCGRGDLAHFMRDQGITQYLGIDFSETAIALARQRSPCFGFIVADVRTTDVFARSHYDVIVCTEVLEHIADDLGLISRFRPGTRCICSVPSFPYESHLRHFRIADEVLGRYSALFDGLDVMTIPAPNETDARFFILDGIRTHTAISVTRQLRGDDERAG